MSVLRSHFIYQARWIVSLNVSVLLLLLFLLYWNCGGSTLANMMAVCINSLLLHWHIYQMNHQMREHINCVNNLQHTLLNSSTVKDEINTKDVAIIRQGIPETISINNIELSTPVEDRSEPNCMGGCKDIQGKKPEKGSFHSSFTHQSHQGSSVSSIRSHRDPAGQWMACNESKPRSSKGEGNQRSSINLKPLNDTENDDNLRSFKGKGDKAIAGHPMSGSDVSKCEQTKREYPKSERGKGDETYSSDSIWMSTGKITDVSNPKISPDKGEIVDDKVLSLKSAHTCDLEATRVKERISTEMNVNSHTNVGQTDEVVCHPDSTCVDSEDDCPKEYRTNIEKTCETSASHNKDHSCNTCVKGDDSNNNNTKDENIKENEIFPKANNNCLPQSNTSDIELDNPRKDHPHLEQFNQAESCSFRPNYLDGDIEEDGPSRSTSLGSKRSDISRRTSISQDEGQSEYGHGLIDSGVNCEGNYETLIKEVDSPEFYADNASWHLDGQQLVIKHPSYLEQSLGQTPMKEEMKEVFGIDLRVDDVLPDNYYGGDGVSLRQLVSNESYRWENLHSVDYDDIPEDAFHMIEATGTGNRPIYDQLKRIDWVMGYFSQGDSIEVYIDLDGSDTTWFHQQLCYITGQPERKFRIVDNEHKWSVK